MSILVELAPNHKIGLSLSSPVMIASGFCGFGTVYRQHIDLTSFGAVVTQPITLRPTRSSPQPRVLETKGGIILNTGQQNPGVKRVLQDNLHNWARLKSRLIVHLPAQEPNDLTRTARAISNVATVGIPTVAAIELGLPNDPDPYDVSCWVKSLQDGSDLPLLVKLPFNASFEVIEAVTNHYVDVLVVGFPPLATTYTTIKGQTMTGHFYGPTLHNLTLAQMQRVLHVVDVPVIAAGGIYTLADAQSFLDSGAAAIQIDTLIFLDPDAAVDIAKSLSHPEEVYT